MKGKITTREKKIDDNFLLKELFGKLDENAKIIEDAFNIDMSLREGSLYLTGEELSLDFVENLLEKLENIIKKEGNLSKQSLNYTIDLVKVGKEEYIDRMLKEVVSITATGKSIRAKTLGQKRYIDSIKKNDIVFGIGPAGTGKTYLAMAMAVSAFKRKEVNRIILTRPAVEAGESLGFLPGDLQEKIDPYLRPLYDALFDILGFNNYLNLMEKGIIEVAPLAYMRGRTLDSAYIILDEAQNTTDEQMKMFLTRLGHGSKAIITGDITQVDLPRGRESGLLGVTRILTDIKGIDFVYLKKEDVVRHSIVQRIIEAYEKFEES